MTVYFVEGYFDTDKWNDEDMSNAEQIASKLRGWGFDDVHVVED